MVFENSQRGTGSRGFVPSLTTLTVLQNVVVREGSVAQAVGTSDQKDVLDFETSFEEALQRAYRSHAITESGGAEIPVIEISQRDFDISGEPSVLPDEIAAAYLNTEFDAYSTILDEPVSVAGNAEDNFTQTAAGPSNVVHADRVKTTREELSEFLVVTSPRPSVGDDSEDEFQKTPIRASSSLSSKSSRSMKGKGKGKGKAVKKTIPKLVNILPASDEDDFQVEARPSTSGLPRKKAKMQVENNQKNSELLRLLQEPVVKLPALKERAAEPKKKGGPKKQVKKQQVNNVAPPLPVPAPVVQEVVRQPGFENAALPQPRGEEVEDELIQVFSQDAARSTIREFFDLLRHTKRSQEEHLRVVEDGVVELRRHRAERDREVATRERLLEELRLVEQRIMERDREIRQVEERLLVHRDGYDKASTKVIGLREVLDRMGTH